MHRGSNDPWALLEVVQEFDATLEARRPVRGRERYTSDRITLAYGTDDRDIRVVVNQPFT